MTLALLLAAGCTSAPPPAVRPPAAAQRTVDCNGGGDHTTLGAAIDAASDGDVIDVEPCTYTERVDFDGKSVTLKATGGPSNTTIDAGGIGPAVTVNNGENAGTGISGFTITGGQETNDGAAIVMDLARLRLDNVVITGNTGGTIIDGYGGNLQLRDVEIVNNTVDAGGKVLHLYRGSLDASELEITCGAAGYGIYLGHNSGIVDHGTLTCPTDTAIYYEHATGRLQRTRVEGLVYLEQEDGNDDDVVIFENDLFLGGAGLTVFEDQVVVRNSIIEGGLRLEAVLDATIEGNVFLDAACAIDADAATAAFTPEYNNFWNVTAQSCQGAQFSGTNGNLAVDPQFTNAAAGVYTLQAGSPLVDAGIPDSVRDDPDGSRNDMGAYGGPKTLAGGW